MTKENFNIDNLRVASPCSVGWETMPGDERRRFCNLCELHVYNFAEMSADEIRALIVKSEGRICGRLYKRADGSILTKDCPVGLRAYRKRVSRFAGASLAAILGLFSVSFGQKENEKSVDASKIKIIRKVAQESFLSGTVSDPNGAVIPNAEIIIFKDNDKKRLNITSNEEGFYKSTFLPAGIYTLEARYRSFVSFKLTQIEIKENQQSNIDIVLEPDGSMLVGDIVVISSETPIDLPESHIDLQNLKPQTLSQPRKPEKRPR